MEQNLHKTVIDVGDTIKFIADRRISHLVHTQRQVAVTVQLIDEERSCSAMQHNTKLLS